MRKVVLLFTTLFLVGCSKGIDDLEIGMTTDEVVDIMGEPDEVVPGWASEMIVDAQLSNHSFALSDKEHEINKDEELKGEAFDLMQRLETVESKVQNGGFLELYSYSDELSLFFIDNELFAIDEVSYKLIPDYK